MAAVTDALSGAKSAAGAKATDRFNAMTSEDFVKVMFTELSRQDPLAPNDTKDLLQQLSTIRNIESNLAVTKRLEDLTRRGDIATAGSLVGKFVKGKTDQGLNAMGYVDSVLVTREGVSLKLSDNSRVPLSNVSEIVDPALVQPGSPTPPTGGAGGGSGDGGKDDSGGGAGGAGSGGSGGSGGEKPQTRGPAGPKS
ncbi:MAG: hypothetical protein IBJ11_09490 [Phycisphaerales bacterium]|nr:hypothetical protein [Phycisphaerales bacterium]